MYVASIFQHHQEQGEEGGDGMLLAMGVVQRSIPVPFKASYIIA
jgi:hypothetical protein